jgi:hypothetical protein
VLGSEIQARGLEIFAMRLFSSLISDSEKEMLGVLD